MDALVIFAKFPIEGQVKKSIGRVIGMDKSASLCKCFIKDLISNHSNQNYDLYLSFIGKEHKEGYRAMFPDSILYIQRGNDLGERMLTTFHDLLDDYRKVVIIGCDVPDISTQIIESAFKALESYDVVLGPASDGGYYLIGLKKPHPIFSGLPWSQPNLMEEQQKRLISKGLTFVLLEEKDDLDTVEELKVVKESLSREQAPCTYDYLQKIYI